MLKKSFTVFMACAMINLSVFAAIPLERGKGLSVRITSNIDSKNLQDNTVSAMVANDIKASDGTILIKTGTPVRLQVNGTRAKGVGKAGHIEVTCSSTTATDGQEILLDGGISAHGKERRGLALGLGLSFGLTFIMPGIGLALLAIKGKNATIPANTIITNAYVASDYMIEQ